MDASNHDHHIMGQAHLPQLLQDAIHMPIEELLHMMENDPQLFTPEQVQAQFMMHQSRLHLQDDEHDPDGPLDIPDPEYLDW